jgi:apolipoprotein D and lipocalin family protein
MKFLRSLGLLFIITVFSVSCSEKKLTPATSFVLDKFMGRWYEIKALPGGIKKGCTCTVFDYKLSGDKEYVMVINSCIKKGKQGAVLAKAFVDESSDAVWDMQFFWPFRKDHVIMVVADDYSYAMAGRADRKSLWIISRSPSLSQEITDSLVTVASSMGFDTSALVSTDHNCSLPK